jgi:hypothetical protein
MASQSGERELFRSLWQVGLDRRHPSIHEMLTDLLEVVEVANGMKPAHLAGQGGGETWRRDRFARCAEKAGLLTLRTPEPRRPEDCRTALAGEFPLVAAALRERAARAAFPSFPEVVWIHREASLGPSIRRLAAGETELIPAVLGYPHCCADHDARGELDFVRAMMRLYRDQHGLEGETAVLRAMETGVSVRPDPAASRDQETVWRTRICFPYLGHNACPQCLARPEDSPSAHLNRHARELAFFLDPNFAAAVWRAALGEAALATAGDFRALDPVAGDPCPCGSGTKYADCCTARTQTMPEFR